MVVKLIPLINLYSFNRSPIYCFWMLEALGVLLVYLTFRLIGIGEIGGRPYLSEKDTHQTDIKAIREHSASFYFPFLCLWMEIVPQVNYVSF